MQRIFSNVILIFCCLLVSITWAYSDYFNPTSEKVVLTLRQGVMTNNLEPPLIPQLKCEGGTAGCETFVPQVVQCFNSDSSGFLVEWECKTKEMPNDLQFGNIKIYCDGYSDHGDIFASKASCWLAYSINFTKEGLQQHHKNSEPIKTTEIEAETTTLGLITNNVNLSFPSALHLDSTIESQHHQNPEQSDAKKERSDSYSYSTIVVIAVGTFASFVVLCLAINVIFIARSISMLLISGGRSTSGYQPPPPALISIQIYGLADEGHQQHQRATL